MIFSLNATFGTEGNSWPKIGATRKRSNIKLPLNGQAVPTGENLVAGPRSSSKRNGHRLDHLGIRKQDRHMKRQRNLAVLERHSLEACLSIRRDSTWKLQSQLSNAQVMLFDAGWALRDLDTGADGLRPIHSNQQQNKR